MWFRVQAGNVKISNLGVDLKKKKNKKKCMQPDISSKKSNLSVYFPEF